MPVDMLPLAAGWKLVHDNDDVLSISSDSDEANDNADNYQQ